MVEIEETSSHKLDQDQVADSSVTDRDVPDVESRLLNTAAANGTAPKNGLKKNEKSEQDRAMTEDINKLLRDMPLTDDMTCGFWILKGKFVQK